MRGCFYVLIILLFPSLSNGQNTTIIDGNKNPIANVSAFNKLKTKSILSNSEGVINLSRFVKDDTIYFQHPQYEIKKICKSDIGQYVDAKIKYQYLEDVVIHHKKNINNINNVAEKKIYISKQDIAELNPANSAEILEKSGGVSVQRSQMGGGSPNIRGFEANKVLLMIDGVRLNNAIYRSGHLQSMITIDEFTLEDIEVVFGPSSVLYGSDALGGTINMKTYELFFRSKSTWKGSIFSNYNSAYNGLRNNASLVFEANRFSSIASFSAKNFGDLRMGTWRPHGYKEWGLVHHYIDNESNSIICNPNPNIQKEIGYSQLDFFNKIIFKVNDQIRLTSNLQYSTSSNVPRFDKLNDGDIQCLMDSNNICLSNENLKFHSYYYGPQNRFFSSLKLSYFDSKYIDKGDVIIAYQNIKESRHKWYLDDFLDYLNNVENYDLPTHQYETVDIYSLNMNFNKGSIYFGSETNYNIVESKTTPNQENIWGIGDTRYPPNGSSMFSTAYYISILKPISHKLQIEGGLRYTFSNVKGEFPDSMHRPLANIEGLNLSSSNNIGSGNIKLLYYPADYLKISSVTARGFHSPNVDDMLKVFRKGDNITIPNIDLKPEHSLSQEISITANIAKNLTLYAVGHYTELTNAIVKDSMQVNINPDKNGDPLLANMILYDDELVYTFSNQNAQDKINIYGFTLGFNAELNGFKLIGDFNFTNSTYNSLMQGPVAHIPPNFGKIELLKAFNLWDFRILCLYSGSKAASEFDDAGVDNLNETPYLGVDDSNGEDVYAGLPHWYIINISGETIINNKLKIQLGVDNILDMHYKTFGSGISAPGRSVNIGINYLL
ncbi:MAG: hypothetical protein CMP49_00785 [Flavobacteriales bacterium]|nr:hypothetical protein [Flavobacteriales bacterium]|tara:strand:+ start:16620 stop:19121 length:2502 start_codon:yes stop_codon:yes gene_type:complete